MIPKIFQSDATDFTSSGYGPLNNAISCTVKQELGSTGVYELNMSILADDPMLEYIKVGNIIAASPNMTDDVQAFVIESINKPIDELVTVYATHIAQHRARLIPVSPINATDLQDALTKIAANSLETNPFTLHSDRTTAVAYKTNAPRSFREILGGTEGSLLDVYGGEYIFDNFDIELVNKRGRSESIQVVYGQNMTEFNMDEDFSYVQSITGILPYWYTEEDGLVQGATQYSDYAGYFKYKKTIVKDYTEYYDSKPTVAQLESVAQNDVTNAGFPVVNMKIAFNQFEEHVRGDVQIMQLGDTVQVINSNYSVDTTSRIVSMTYNVLSEMYDEIQIGELQQSINEAINDSLIFEENELNPYMPGRGIEINDHIITNKFEKLQNPNLDDIDYYFIGVVAGSTNYPADTNAAGMFACIPGAENAQGVITSFTQFYSPYNKKEVYFRKYYSSAWQEWIIINTTRVQLWENDSPTSEFAPKTIQLDLSSYKEILIQYKITASSTSYVDYASIPNGYDNMAFGVLTSANTLYKRLATVRSTGVQFYSGYSGTSTSNTSMVPFRIYGIK